MVIERPDDRTAEHFAYERRRHDFPKLDYILRKLVHERAKYEAELIETACEDAIARHCGVNVIRYRSGLIEAYASDLIPFGNIYIHDSSKGDFTDE